MTMGQYGLVDIPMMSLAINFEHLRDLVLTMLRIQSASRNHELGNLTWPLVAPGDPVISRICICARMSSSWHTHRTRTIKMYLSKYCH